MLTGKAERVFESMTGDKTKIGEIKRALQEGCTETKEVLLHKFYSAKPKTGELLSAYAIRLQDLLTKAMPDLKVPEMSIILRGQLATHLPDYMKALITFNQKTTWDELLTALDAAHPYVNKLIDSSQCKDEYLEANMVTSKSKDERSCFLCKERGHLIRNYPKRHNKQDSWRSPRKSFGRCGSDSNEKCNTAYEGERYHRRDNDNQFSNGNKRNSYNGYQQDSSRKSWEKKKNQASAYTLNAEANSSDSDELEKFSKLSLKAIEIKSISQEKEVELKREVVKENKFSLTLDLNTMLSKVPLLKKSIYFSLAKGMQVCKLRALFDGGASNSFVRLSCLPPQLQKAIKQFKNGEDTDNVYGFSKETLTICGATSSETETCVIVAASLAIGDWKGQHKVVITESLIDKDVILGRGFLKKYHVVINHGTDEIKIDKVLDTNKLSDPVCYVVSAKEIVPRTGNVIKCHTNVIPAGKDVLFTPSQTADSVYWSNCVSRVNDEGDFFVKVINLGSENFKIEEGARVGVITEDFEQVKDSESYELKTVNMSKENKSVVEDLKQKLSRLKFGNKLSSEQTDKLKSLIRKNMAAFQWTDDDVGRTNLIEHEIDTGNSKPIKQRQFKIPQAVQSVLDSQIKDLVKNNMIEPSTSPWCSPMMIVKQKKRDGTIKYRFVCDMKGVNSVTVKDSFP